MEGRARPPPFGPLDRAFNAAMDHLLEGISGVTVLFSGGVDSSLIALAAGQRSAVRLVTVGREGSPDLRWAAEASRLLGLTWEPRPIDLESVRSAIARTGFGTWPEPRRSVFVSLALALGPDSIGPVLLGQGADELFGGYAHFRGLFGEALESRRLADWQRLVREDWPATQELGRTFGRRVEAPFLDGDFSREALRRPLATVAPGEPTKPTFRAWARHRGVPEEIAARPKRAIQYGSGVADLVARSGRA
ncbi:MAG TPA: asparagine synthase-related protein [Thermoplasmata archaeon]|nr:asparagine synthase-related protein [Thermoplasmata archaeon]